jgi:hypothetical protein
VFPTTSTSTTRRGTRGLALVATVAVFTGLAFSLTACSPAEAGAAAVVGDHRISTAEVSDAVTGIKEGNRQLSGEGLDRTVLFFLVVSPFVLPAAQANGVAVSKDQARQLLPGDPTPDPGAVRVLQTFLALQQLQQAGKNDALAQIQKDVAAAKPELNPRFGTFDVSQMAVVDAPPNWIVPTAEPTATSGATP